METVKAATIEKQVNELVSKYVYAVIADIKVECDEKNKYSEYVMQNYANLCLPKQDREKLTAIFTISQEVKQFYAHLLSMIVIEMRNIDLDEDEDVQSIVKKLVDANADCFTQYIVAIGNEYKNSFGATLKNATDVEQYFHNRIMGQLPQYKSKAISLMKISRAFDNFLKATAWIIGQQMWYEKQTIGWGYFLGLLASLRIPTELRIILQNEVPKREIKPKKKPAITAPPVTPQETIINPEMSNILDNI